jgi:ribonuclease HI
VKLKFVQLIVDGSALGNPGVGGWACIMKHGMQERVLTGSEPQATNNRMEMIAALRGLQALKEPCDLEVVTLRVRAQKVM